MGAEHLGAEILRRLVGAAANKLGRRIERTDVFERAQETVQWVDRWSASISVLDDYLVSRQFDVFHAESEAFADAESATVQQLDDQIARRSDRGEKLPNFVARESRRQLFGSPSPCVVADVADVEFEYLAV